MTPTMLLDDATAMVTLANAELTGLWPRAGALLARQALEDAIESLFRERAPGLEHASARVKLICLSFYADEQIAHDAAQVWAELSRACHVHSYELAPTGHELAQWIDRVEQVVATLEAAARR